MAFESLIICFLTIRPLQKISGNMVLRQICADKNIAVLNVAIFPLFHIWTIFDRQKIFKCCVAKQKLKKLRLSSKYALEHISDEQTSSDQDRISLRQEWLKTNYWFVIYMQFGRCHLVDKTFTYIFAPNLRDFDTRIRKDSSTSVFLITLARHFYRVVHVLDLWWQTETSKLEAQWFYWTD